MPNILIIDDDRLAREATKTLLAKEGYTVVLAEDGKSGIKAAQSGKFDAAIVDVFMPDMNGLEVIEVLHQSNPRMPMIAASGFMFGDSCPQMPNFDVMAAEAGAISTLYKPFRPETLLQAVEKAIGASS
jgi:CheY-like chemotaxis protein